MEDPGNDRDDAVATGAATDTERTVFNTEYPDSGQFGTGGDVQAGGGRRLIKDRFVLEESLGRGGMGQVFRALDLRKREAQDDRPYVAIKLLGPAFSRHPKALISLQREARKTQELAHPNIVTVYDFDRDGPHVYMTMELLDGAPLSNWETLPFEDNRRPTLESMITQLAEGLAYAHSRGVVHSDLKPDNVFVTREGRIKILDFGIARIAEDAARQDSFDAGQLGGLTPRYASLEMIDRSADPQPADDLYALGVIAYQLYGGAHPYGGLSAREALDQGLQPPPLKGLPRHRQRAIEQALRLRRRDRTASAAEFLATFGGARRRRRALAAAMVLLLVSSVFFAYLSTREAGPSVPFDELPTVVQEELTHKLEAGRRSASIGDWDGASRYFMDSWVLHPRNPAAREGLAGVVVQLQARADGATSQRERELLLRFMDAYAEHPYFAESRPFRELRAELSAALQ